MATADAPWLLSLLADAYGSTARAQVALDGALGRAALDEVPSLPDEVVYFLSVHLHAIAELDLGSFIADALTEELVSLADAPGQRPAPSKNRPSGHVWARSPTRATPQPPSSAPFASVQPRISELRVRGATSIMLVRVDSAEEANVLDLKESADSVFRVKHALPACERIRVVRPLVVIVGSAVTDRDVELVTDAARDNDSEVLVLKAFVTRATLCEALQRAVARASSRRARALENVGGR